MIKLRLTMLNVLCLCLCMCLCLSAYSVAQTITIYSYHNHPPFVTGQNSGLTFELARQLNEQAGDRYFFKVSIVPHERLNYLLKDWIRGACPNSDCKQNWIVPWVNPKWGFIKGGYDNYLWHEQFKDSNVILSRASERWTYLGPSSIKGLLFAGMRGHHYLEIDDFVASGDIKRIDGNRERDNILKLLYQRVDVTLLPASTVAYLLENDPKIKAQAKQIKINDKKHHKYMRYIMLPESRTSLLAFVKNIKLKELSFNSKSSL